MAPAPSTGITTLADLLHQLGDIPPHTGYASALSQAPQPSKMCLHETQTLTGGTVLPGFTLTLQDLFAELDRQESG